MKRLLAWVKYKDPLYLIKIQQLVAVLYTLVDAVLNSIGVLMYDSSLLSMSVLSTVTVFLISITRSGRLYFSRLFRASIILLLMPSCIRQLWRWGIITESTEIKVVLAISIAAFVAFFLGLMLGNKNKRNEKTDSSAQS